MIHDDAFPTGGHWPGARNFISLAELSGVTPRRARAHRRPQGISLAELSGLPVAPRPGTVRVGSVPVAGPGAQDSSGFFGGLHGPQTGADFFVGPPAAPAGAGFGPGARRLSLAGLAGLGADVPVFSPPGQVVPGLTLAWLAGLGGGGGATSSGTGGAGGDEGADGGFDDWGGDLAIAANSFAAAPNNPLDIDPKERYSAEEALASAILQAAGTSPGYVRGGWLLELLGPAVSKSVGPITRNMMKEHNLRATIAFRERWNLPPLTELEMEMASGPVRPGYPNYAGPNWYDAFRNEAERREWEGAVEALGMAAHAAQDNAYQNLPGPPPPPAAAAQATADNRFQNLPGPPPPPLSMAAAQGARDNAFDPFDRAWDQYGDDGGGDGGGATSSGTGGAAGDEGAGGGFDDWGGGAGGVGW